MRSSTRANARKRNPFEPALKKYRDLKIARKFAYERVKSIYNYQAEVQNYNYATEIALHDNRMYLFAKIFHSIILPIYLLILIIGSWGNTALYNSGYELERFILAIIVIIALPLFLLILPFMRKMPIGILLFPLFVSTIICFAGFHYNYGLIFDGNYVTKDLVRSFELSALSSIGITPSYIAPSARLSPLVALQMYISFLLLGVLVASYAKRVIDRPKTSEHPQTPKLQPANVDIKARRS